MKKSLTDWAGAAHALALERGDWDRERQEVEIFAEGHGDLHRALVEYRSNRPMLYCGALEGNPCEDCEMADGACGSVNAQSRPSGTAAECARVILRMLDYLGALCMDVDGLIAAVLDYDMRQWLGIINGGSAPHEHTTAKPTAKSGSDAK